jgi:hypothetical protein
MSFIDAKPTDSKESLLNDIMVAAANQSHRPGLPLRPFAALVIKVADETAETVADLKAHISYLNDQNAKLQRWVVALAVAALVGTFVQTAAALYAVSAPNSSSAAPSSAASIEATRTARPLEPPVSPSVAASSPATTKDTTVPPRLAGSAVAR